MDIYVDYYDFGSNQEMLNAQLETNQQLQQLRSQISQCNYVNQQILQNQIRDIEERETQKFYKNRVFKINQLINSINNCSDVDQKAFLYAFFDETIHSNIYEAMSILNEIQDKEYCAQMLNNYSQKYNTFFNSNTISIGEELVALRNGKSEYNGLHKCLTQLLSQRNKLNNVCKPTSLNPYVSKIVLCVLIIIVLLIIKTMIGINLTGLGYFIILLLPSLFLIYAIVNTYIYNNERANQVATFNADKKNIAQQIAKTISQLENCQYTQAINSLTNKFPSWNSVLAENRRYLTE